MKRNLGSIDDFVRKHLTTASQEDIEQDIDHVFQSLPAASNQQVFTFEPASRSRRRPALLLAGVAAFVLAVVISVGVRPAAPALLEAFSGSRKIEFGEVVRSGDVAGSALVLADSSRVEMRAKSELVLERADDGVRIRLNKGSVLVTAAKQHNGHLYVQTKDVTVSVVGTVFLVNAEEEGSRVAVIEGEVRVKQGATERSLRKGEHVATNPRMETSFVSKELEWSPEVETQLALLQQAPAPSPVTPAVPTQSQEKFEVATIRFKPRADGGRGVSPDVESCPLPRMQIDPQRLSIPGATLNSLITLAYPEWADTHGGGCIGVTAGGILSGGPGWVRSDLWDIQATIPEGPIDYKVTAPAAPPAGARGPRQGLPTPAPFVDDIGPRVRGMLRNLLADRFQLVLRPQTKEMPVYLLTAGKEGFKSNGNPGFAIAPNGQTALMNGVSLAAQKGRILRRIIEVDGKSVFVKPEGAAYEEYLSVGLWKMPMSEFAMSLNSELERPVLDRTNLTGTFDFHLDYTNGKCCQNPSRPTLFKALEDVGLKLEPSRAPVEVWVIERAERPSEN